MQCKRHYLKSQKLSKIVLFTEQMQYLPLRAIGSIYRKAKTKQVSFLDADSSCQIYLEYYVKFLVKSLVKCEHPCISYGNKFLEDISKIFDFIRDRKVRTLNKTSEAQPIFNTFWLQSFLFTGILFILVISDRRSNQKPWIFILDHISNLITRSIFVLKSKLKMKSFLLPS